MIDIFQVCSFIALLILYWWKITNSGTINNDSLLCKTLSVFHAACLQVQAVNNKLLAVFHSYALAAGARVITILIPITHDYVMFSTAMVPCVYQISRLVKLSIANSLFFFYTML